MEQEINIKVLLPPDYKVDDAFLMDIINGLNDRYVPITQITLNGVEKFNNVQGFVKEQKNLNEEEKSNE
jgi:hypothetical protein